MSARKRLAQCTRAALNAGRRTRAAVDEPFEGTAENRQKLAVDAGGFNLEATTGVEATDREALERLCRYLLAPRAPLRKRICRIKNALTRTRSMTGRWREETGEAVGGAAAAGVRS